MTIAQRRAITPLPHRGILMTGARFISRNLLSRPTRPVFCDSAAQNIFIGMACWHLLFHSCSFFGFSMFLVINTNREGWQTHQAYQLTIAQIVDQAVRAILLIAFTSVVAAFSAVPLIPGIYIFYPSLALSCLAI